MLYRLVLLGPPASGKGTQGRIMAARWRVPVVSVGEMLRREITARSLVGVEASLYLDRGQLVPDAVAIATVDQWLESQLDGAFVFDGFPRTVGQAEALGTLLAQRGSPLTAVVWLDLDDARIAERVSRRLTCVDCGTTFQLGSHVQSRDEACPVCGGKLTVRGDDDPVALTARMQTYRERTEPVAAYYAERGLLRRIDASGTPEAVFARIEAAVAESELGSRRSEVPAAQPVQPQPAEVAATV